MEYSNQFLNHQNLKNIERCLSNALYLIVHVYIYTSRKDESKFEEEWAIIKKPFCYTIKSLNVEGLFMESSLSSSNFTAPLDASLSLSLIQACDRSKLTVVIFKWLLYINEKYQFTINNEHVLSGFWRLLLPLLNCRFNYYWKSFV